MKVEELFQPVNEVFDVEDVVFGTNQEADNGEVRKMGSSQFTFFKEEDLFYAVAVDGDGIVGFAVSPVYSPNIQDYSVNRIKTINAFKVFSKVMNVLAMLVKKASQPIYYLKFAAADDKLAGLYTKMVKNNRLLKEVRKMGFRYVGVMEEKGIDRYIFARTS